MTAASILDVTRRELGQRSIPAPPRNRVKVLTEGENSSSSSQWLNSRTNRRTSGKVFDLLHPLKLCLMTLKSIQYTSVHPTHPPGQVSRAYVKDDKLLCFHCVRNFNLLCFEFHQFTGVWYNLPEVVVMKFSLEMCGVIENSLNETKRKVYVCLKE